MTMELYSNLPVELTDIDSAFDISAEIIDAFDRQQPEAYTNLYSAITATDTEIVVDDITIFYPSGISVPGAEDEWGRVILRFQSGEIILIEGFALDPTDLTNKRGTMYVAERSPDIGRGMLGTTAAIHYARERIYNPVSSATTTALIEAVKNTQQEVIDIFSNTTGHDHSGSQKGKQIPTAGIADAAITTDKIVADAVNTTKIDWGTGLNQVSTTDVPEGTNLYYTSARFDTAFALKDTDDLTEGSSNLYLTSSNFNTYFGLKTTTDLAEGANLYYTTARWDARLLTKTSDNIPEGTTNLYFTPTNFNTYFSLSSHTNLLDIGTNTHAQIDTAISNSVSHIADNTKHFLEGAIDHTNILNIGSNAHSVIDTHIANSTIHFTNPGFLYNPVNLIQFNTSYTNSSPAEGDIWWNSDDGTLNVKTDLDSTIQVGQEETVRVINNTGTTITNGSVCQMFSADVTAKLPEIILAKADTFETCQGVLGIATSDILDGQEGFMTVRGVVRDIDTSGLTPNVPMYLSATTAGALTSTPPPFPNHKIFMGGPITIDATTGMVQIHIDDNINDIINAAFNGSFIETFDALVTSDGSTITMSLERSGGGNLTANFSTGYYTIDCTPAATIALTAGSDASPQDNYIYILESTKALTKSTTGWPATEHIKIAYFLVPSAIYVAANGAYVNQNWNDHLAGTNGQGHMSHIGEHLRAMGAVWFSGVAPNGVDDYLTITAGNVEVKTTAGVVYQMHKHDVPAWDTSVGDEVLVTNWNGDAYHNITNLHDIVADSNGNSLTGDWFGFTLWGVANKTGEYAPLMINLPSGSYGKENDALSDKKGYANFNIPREFNNESSTGFLIAYIVVEQGATWNYSGYVDLRGTNPSTATGGAAGTITSFPDNTFEVYNVTAPTKILDFDCSGITVGNTRTLTVPDASGTIALTSDVIPISTGGTGQTTAQAAIDALSQVSGATNEYVLTKDTASGNALWKASSAGFSDPMTTRGDIIVRDASNTTARLAVGGAGTVLSSDGTDVSWAASGSGAPTDASYLTLGLDGDLSAERVLTAGEGIDFTDGGANGTLTIDGEDATTANKGIVELAIASEINTGTSTSLAVTPDSLAGSIYGTKSICIVPFASDETTEIADGTIGFCVPLSMAGMNLVDATASVYTAGTTGTTDIQLRRRRSTTNVDMLSTKLTIDSGEICSKDATTHVINTSNDDLAEGDLIFVDVDAVSTTPATGLSVTLEFRLP